jgi:hypothetical protein
MIWIIVALIVVVIAGLLATLVLQRITCTDALIPDHLTKKSNPSKIDR